MSLTFTSFNANPADNSSPGSMQPQGNSTDRVPNAVSAPGFDTSIETAAPGFRRGSSAAFLLSKVISPHATSASVLKWARGAKAR